MQAHRQSIHHRSTQRKPLQRNSTRPRNNSAFGYAKLETRKLLASINFDSGVLLLEGSGGDDVFRVDQKDATTFVARIETPFETLSESFAKSSVGSVEVRGRNGDDVFNNATALNSTFFGHNGNDEFVGGDSVDIFFGGDGNDFFFGGRGNDQAFGSNGNDLLLGGQGDDILNGQNGDDFVSGGAGSDEIRGNDGRDRLFGLDGDDALFGGEGDDFVTGGSGADAISGDAGDDSLQGGVGDDEIHGGAGNDGLIGGDGDDSLYGDGNVDFLDGGNGNDGLFGGVGSSDRLVGGDGADRLLVFSDATVNGGRTLDVVLDGDAEDAVVNFTSNVEIETENIDTVGRWTGAEIKIVDGALRNLHRETGDTRLLKLSDGQNITIARLGDVRTSNGSPVLGLNFSNSNAIGFTNQLFADFPQRIRETVYHELGHNFDTNEENSFVAEFRAISNWDQTRDAGDRRSSDGQWYYNDSFNNFLTANARINPREDFAVTFAEYFQQKYDGFTRSFVNPVEKFAVIESFLQS